MVTSFQFYFFLYQYAKLGFFQMYNLNMTYQVILSVSIKFTLTAFESLFAIKYIIFGSIP